MYSGQQQRQAGCCRCSRCWFHGCDQGYGLKEPYVGQVALQTSEIAEDLTYYFATSEQVPSAVGLGVLMNKDNTVRQAGGFIVQLMPFAEEEVISKLEENVSKIDSVTNLLEQGHTPESFLRKFWRALT